MKECKYRDRGVIFESVLSEDEEEGYGTQVHCVLKPERTMWIEDGEFAKR